MSIRTLFRKTSPDGRATVRFIARDVKDKPFAVVLDVPSDHAAFETFHDFDLAAGFFTTQVNDIMNVTHVPGV